MKGVILGIAPEARLVDISHDVRSYDVVEGTFFVENTYRYFPEGTVHIVVVDPGVGSARRPIVSVSDHQIFVGPDNGVLSPVLQNEVYHITNQNLFLSRVSKTFHGRDIFAPVAANIAHGMPVNLVGPRIVDFMRVSLPLPRPQGNKLLGRVLRIDKFGNIITNFRRRDLGPNFTIRVEGLPITRLCSNFSEAEPGEFFAVEGSTGYIELALNQGSAADRLSVERGAEIEVESGLANH
jgi:S-adenosylmethionine hydrolase